MQWNNVKCFYFFSDSILSSSKEGFNIHTPWQRFQSGRFGKFRKAEDDSERSENVNEHVFFTLRSINNVRKRWPAT